MYISPNDRIGRPISVVELIEDLPMNKTWFTATIQLSDIQDDYTEYEFRAWNELHAILKVAKKCKAMGWQMIKIEKKGEDK